MPQHISEKQTKPAVIIANPDPQGWAMVLWQKITRLFVANAGVAALLEYGTNLYPQLTPDFMANLWIVFLCGCCIWFVFAIYRHWTARILESAFNATLLEVTLEKQRFEIETLLEQQRLAAVEKQRELNSDLIKQFQGLDDVFTEGVADNRSFETQQQARLAFGLGVMQLETQMSILSPHLAKAILGIEPKVDSDIRRFIDSHRTNVLIRTVNKRLAGLKTVSDKMGLNLEIVNYARKY